MECPTCHRLFSRRDVMLRHYRNQHGSGDTPPPPPCLRWKNSRRRRRPCLRWKNSRRRRRPCLRWENSRRPVPFLFRHPFTMIVSGPTSCRQDAFRGESPPRSGSDVRTGAAENRLAVQEVATPLRRRTRRRAPAGGVCERHPRRPGERRLLRSESAQRGGPGRSDDPRQQRHPHQRSLHRRKSPSKSFRDRHLPEPCILERTPPREETVITWSSLTIRSIDSPWPPWHDRCTRVDPNISCDNSTRPREDDTVISSSTSNRRPPRRRDCARTS
ncbi:Hypothetical predicted protein [Mytilus galloprovincialis]|uniref:C2H2-type domain-containing protein n=1 Tax=Mytilus galloprovincialis TaxID=29158 RepID=A0A8B6CTP1_MYTGA|nr:Hypothetical predicted protein [Mytilus galloprovincialis]